MRASAGLRRLLLHALGYFGLVFTAGFILGVLRTLFVVPYVGSRAAELVEAPLMLGAIVLCARLIARRYGGPRSGLVAVGTLAAIAVLSADVLVGIGLRDMKPLEALFGRDVIAGPVYYLLVATFAAMPWLMGRNAQR